MTEMFGEAWSPMSVPDLAPDDDDDCDVRCYQIKHRVESTVMVSFLYKTSISLHRSELRLQGG